MGVNALSLNTTGYYNSAMGVSAGLYIADGATGNQTSITSLYLGAETKSLANGDENEIVIGYNATGLGSNTVVLGNSSITTTALRGKVGVGTLQPIYKTQINSDILSAFGISTTGRGVIASIDSNAVVNFAGSAGTATIGAGDSVQVTILGLTPATGVAWSTYKRAQTAAPDTAATYRIDATNTLTLFGKFGWQVGWGILRK
jgi:hypothetical protein